MKTKYALPLAALAVFSSLTGLAQDSDHSWSKTYPVTGKPTLTLETSDASVEFRPCGDCHEIRIHIEVVGRKLSDYRLEEGQSGDEVHFLFKDLPHLGGHIAWHREEARVTVESPAQLTLQARTSDGNVTLSGLQGDLDLTTGDGNVALDHVSGNLRIKSGDGQVKITNADGASRHGRFRIRPESGTEYLSDKDAAARSANFLFDEIGERLSRGPVKLGVFVQMAEPGDNVTDASVAWPAGRAEVPFGAIVLTGRVDDQAAEQRKIIFDPLPRIEGIDSSGDPLTEVRADLYLLSGRRRRAAMGDGKH